MDILCVITAENEEALKESLGRWGKSGLTYARNAEGNIEIYRAQDAPRNLSPFWRIYDALCKRISD